MKSLEANQYKSHSLTYIIQKSVYCSNFQLTINRINQLTASLIQYWFVTWKFKLQKIYIRCFIRECNWTFHISLFLPS